MSDSSLPDGSALVHFAGPWSRDETRLVHEAAAVAALHGLPAVPQGLGCPWVATKHVFSSFVLYIANHVTARLTLTASDPDGLAKQIRSARARSDDRAPNVFQLVYESEAARPMRSADLRELLRQSREKNQRLGITGVLLFKAGGFIQVLEGDEEAVRSLYATICDDARHEDVETLLTALVTHRVFPDWTMGLENLDRVLEDEEGVNSFLQDGRVPGLRSSLPAVCQALEAFKEREPTGG